MSPALNESSVLQRFKCDNYRIRKIPLVFFAQYGNNEVVHCIYIAIWMLLRCILQLVQYCRSGKFRV